ncbi:MAG: CAP domain-containing protein [Pseudomonadota bacterium]
MIIIINNIRKAFNAWCFSGIAVALFYLSTPVFSQSAITTVSYSEIETLNAEKKEIKGKNDLITSLGERRIPMTVHTYVEGSSTGSGRNRSATKICLELTNALRKTLGLPPFAASADLANNAAIGITYDSSHGGVHAHAGVTNVGENMYGESGGGNDDATIIKNAVNAWWREGPSPNGEFDEAHGHYMNLVGDYTQAGCAIGDASGMRNVYINLK